MKLSKIITTREDISDWTSFLEGRSKEELIDILLVRLIEDPKFSASLQSRYGSEEMSIDETLDEYRKSIDDELYEKYPDVQYIEKLSEALMAQAERETSLMIKCRIYTEVIVNLDQSINEGAGHRNEEEDLLIDLMELCLEDMKSAMVNKEKEMSVEEIMEVWNFLRKAARGYNPSDGKNRIKEAGRKLSDLTSKRTGINSEGGYVRGAEYYRNLGKQQMHENSE